MELTLHGRTLSVGQLGNDFLLLNEPVEMPAGDATLRVRIDESEQFWKVKVPEGTSAFSNRVRLAIAD